MNPRFRKFLAASQVLGGLMVLYVPFDFLLARLIAEWWFWMGALCYGGLAVMAGMWLWRDEAGGWAMSSIVQALQIVQFQSSSFRLIIEAGVQMRLFISTMGVDAGPGFDGSFSIDHYGGGGWSWWISINLFSIYAVYALLRYGPDREVTPHRDGQLAGSTR